MRQSQRGSVESTDSAQCDNAHTPAASPRLLRVRGNQNTESRNRLNHAIARLFTEWGDMGQAQFNQHER